jgi:hypothetical protein
VVLGGGETDLAGRRRFAVAQIRARRHGIRSEEGRNWDMGVLSMEFAGSLLPFIGGGGRGGGQPIEVKHHWWATFIGVVTWEVKRRRH